MSGGKIILQHEDFDTAAFIANLLEQYGYETHTSTSPIDTAILARCFGPVDAVLCGEDEASDELRTALAELTPETRLLTLPDELAGHGTEGAAGWPAGGSSLVFDPGELVTRLQKCLGERAERPRGVAAADLPQIVSETMLTFLLLLEQLDLGIANSRLVMEYGVRVARELGLSTTHCQEVAFAALLQDIGLCRRRGARNGAPLTPDQEARVVEEHPIRSADLAQRIRLPWNVRHIILAHHEWYNGLGYPRGLAGRDIPLGARILAVVNAFFAMILPRRSRRGIAQDEALEELRRMAGRQFDAEIVEIVLTLMKDKTFRRSAERRVLVATSDDGYAGRAASLFAAAGVALERVAEGASVLPALTAGRFDALLLDGELSDMSGLQVLHWVRTADGFAELPVIVLGDGAADGAGSFAAHSLGADDLVSKEAVSSRLVARVNAVIRRRDRLARGEAFQVHDGEGLRGSFDEVPLADLAQIMLAGTKTASIDLVGPTGRAVLGFERGELVHARVGDVVGAKAFREMLSWSSADYVIAHGATTAERTIETRAELLTLDDAELAGGDGERQLVAS